jgi:hypothetical protein
MLVKSRVTQVILLAVDVDLVIVLTILRFTTLWLAISVTLTATLGSWCTSVLWLGLLALWVLLLQVLVYLTH